MYQKQKPFTMATDVFIWRSQQITWSQKQYPMIASYSSNWLYAAFSVEDYKACIRIQKYTIFKQARWDLSVSF